MRTQRSSPVALRSRRSNETFAPAKARSMCSSMSAKVPPAISSCTRRPSRSSGATPTQSPNGLFANRSFRLPVEMDDRRADAVGDQAQPVLAPARLELQPLQLVDVGVADEEAADIAVRAAVRVIVDVDPDRRPARHRQLPLEPGALAGERRVDVGLVQRKRLPPVDVLDLLADHVDEDLAGPLEERLVDEAVAPVAVHIGQRQADRVQLPLRQRSQVGRAGPGCRPCARPCRARTGKGTGSAPCGADSWGIAPGDGSVGVVHL